MRSYTLHKMQALAVYIDLHYSYIYLIPRAYLIGYLTGFVITEILAILNRDIQLYWSMIQDQKLIMSCRSFVKHNYIPIDCDIRFFAPNSIIGSYFFQEFYNRFI
jgi:hypothetical protein